MSKRMLVTAALPYANGPIHLGHIVEHVQTDVFVRALRSLGREAVFLCADDTHGTPIEVSARKQNITPEALVARYATEHQRDFADFQVEHAFYGSTNSPQNRTYAELIFERLRAGGHIQKRPVEQFYCETDQRFLPDRFIRGTCPNCKTADQYGDVCEACGKTYSPTELIEPRCSLCGRPPVRRSSDHYFVGLAAFTGFLKEFTASGALDPVVRNGLQKWFEEGLADWDVSRDGPYFGFKIPGETDKYFYVWLDAPIGYISTTELWCGDALRYWAPDADAEIVHVIGKDIVYFHTLFWPAMLRGAHFKVPDRVAVHGMLTMNGEKMSKTRGTFINARDYLDKLDPAYLRYFLASNLGPTPEDIDLSLEEFRNRVNAELVNNIGNLCNRSLKMIAANFGGRLADARESPRRPSSGRAIWCGRPACTTSASSTATRSGAPRRWAIGPTSTWRIGRRGTPSKTETRPAAKPHTATFRFPPRWPTCWVPCSTRSFPVSWSSSSNSWGRPRSPSHGRWRPKDPCFLPNHTIGEPRPLIPRLEAKQVEALIQVQGSPAAEVSPVAARLPTPSVPAVVAASNRDIAYDDFAKVDIRVGRVLTCEPVPGADKLLKLSVDVGEPQPRTIASGIARFYKPEALVGRSLLVVVNLAPREFKKLSVTSFGMILASSGSGTEEKLAVVDAPPGLPPGSTVK